MPSAIAITQTANFRGEVLGNRVVLNSAAGEYQHHSKRARKR